MLKFQKNRIIIFLGILFVIFLLPKISQAATANAASGNVYYASPTGGGDGFSQSSPFTIVNFWSVAKPGDTLYLLNGTYRGTNSMIDPPQYLHGQPGNPIIVKALNDGKVLIDGEHARYPVFLYRNNYYLIEGANACCSSASVVSVSEGTGNTFKKVIAWDADPASNSHIFSSGTNAVDTLFEDVAGWGSGRKIFSLYQDTRTTIRRCFFRWTYHTNSTTAFFKLGLTIGYYSKQSLIENCIGTWDQLPGTFNEQRYAIFGADKGNVGDDGHKLLGSIGYHLSSQSGNPSYIFGTRYEDISPYLGSYEIKDFIGYTDRSDEIGVMSIDSYDTVTASNLTSIGGYGVGSSWSPYGLYADHISGKVNNVIVKDALRFGTNEGSRFNSIMYWNNVGGDYMGSAPTNYLHQNPQLTANNGNILQYGLSQTQRPQVNGQPVGAQIQYRYINGVLTNEPLWPWPMNDRIKEAMMQSGYDQKGGLDGKGGFDLTKVVFELGGGTMPDFNTSAPDTTPPAPPSGVTVN